MLWRLCTCIVSEWWEAIYLLTLHYILTIEYTELDTIYLPNFTVSDITLVAWNQPWWECFHHGNQQTPQIQVLFFPRESAVKHLLACH